MFICKTGKKSIHSAQAVLLLQVLTVFAPSASALAATVVLFPPENPSFNCVEIEDLLVAELRRNLGDHLPDGYALLPQHQMSELQAEFKIYHRGASSDELREYMMAQLTADFAIGITVLDFQYDSSEGEGEDRNVCTYEQWFENVAVAMYPQRPDMKYVRPMPKRYVRQTYYNYSRARYVVSEDRADASLSIAIYLYGTGSMAAIYENTGEIRQSWTQRNADSDLDVARLCECPTLPEYDWERTTEGPRRLSESRSAFTSTREGIPDARELLVNKLRLFAKAEAVRISRQLTGGTVNQRGVSR
jgi:hypothetical protein